MAERDRETVFLPFSVYLIRLAVQPILYRIRIVWLSDRPIGKVIGINSVYSVLVNP